MGNVPRIVATGTAVPPFHYEQDSVRERARLHFQKGLKDVERLIAVFDSVQVSGRYFCVPPEWLECRHTFTEKNRAYQEWAERLSAQAVRNCLKAAGVPPDDVHHLLFVSTSGLATPSIDARLVQNLGFSSHVRRTPIFGLGCAGGAAGLARCMDLARATPRGRILLVAVEISSLTFQRNDFSRANLIASALFSDGAAAVLVCGDECPEEGTEIVDSSSTLWPGTLNVMGWEFSEEGLSVVFSPRIPTLLTETIAGIVSAFLAGNRLQPRDIQAYVLHPGGAKILAALQTSLDIPTQGLDHSRYVLANYGNMSSATVLFVLDRHRSSGLPRPGQHALCMAFGPGFSSELVLLRGRC